MKCCIDCGVKFDGERAVRCEPCRANQIRRKTKERLDRKRAARDAARPERRCMTCGVPLGTKRLSVLYCATHAVEVRRASVRQYMRRARQHPEIVTTRPVVRVPVRRVSQAIDVLEYAPTEACQLPQWLEKLDDRQFIAVLPASAVSCFETMTPRVLSQILVQARDRFRGSFVSVGTVPHDAARGGTEAAAVPASEVA